MTKTQRRRTTRAAHQRAADAIESAAPVDYAAAAKLLEDPTRWKLLDEALGGLVTIEFTSPFVDMELMCPEEAHLVVDLDQTDRIQPHSHRRHHPTESDLQHRVARALDALATLCATAQCLSPWNDLYQSFWQRVAEADVLGTSLPAPIIEKWVRFTKARGIPLLLSWSKRPFLLSLIMAPLQAFLSTPRRGSYGGDRLLVTVGLRFTQATMTTSVMETLHELLKIPSGDPDTLLIDPTCLRTLWFNSNPFYVPELSVLAALLRDPMTRRVDELKLEKFIVQDAPAVAERAFEAAFSQVVASACTIKTSDALIGPPLPLSLSLGGNVLFHEHVDAIREVVAHSARPVRLLSFAGAYPTTEIAWKSLTDLIFCPLPTAASRAVLNLTAVSSQKRYSLGLAQLIRSFVESFWSTGAIDDRSVECCLSSGTTPSRAPHGFAPLYGVVPPHCFLAVEDYNPATQYLKVSFPKSSVEGETKITTGWVSVSNITQLRHAGTLLVGTSFTRLIYDCPARYGKYTNDTVLELTTIMGSQLQSLALENHGLRWWSTYPDLVKILQDCSQLLELSLKRSSFVNDNEDDLWDESFEMQPSPSLQILNLSHCSLCNISFRRLSTFPQLRYLQLQGNAIGTIGVESLLAMILANKELETVELNHHYSQTPSLPTDIHARIDTHLRREYLQPRDKAAVLSVFAHLQRQNPRLPFPGNDVIALVFAFAGTKPRRVVKWYD